MVALQLGSVIGWWNCLAGEGVHEICHCPTSQPIAAETSILGGVLWVICVFQNNRGDFRLPETETRMTPWSMHLEQNPRLNGRPAQMPENGLEVEPEPEDFTSEHVGIAPSLLI